MSMHAQYLVGGVAFYTTVRAPHHIEFASNGPAVAIGYASVKRLILSIYFRAHDTYV